MLAILDNQPQVTIKTMTKLSSMSSATVKRALKRLKEAGKLRRVGGTRGSWVVVK